MRLAGLARLLLLPALALAACVPAAAEQASPMPAPVPEYRLKAAFVYNFVLFTDWPAPSDAGALNVCVGSDSGLRAAMAEFHDRTVKGRRLAVRGWAEDDAARHCHVLVLDSADRERWARLRKAIAGASVLTVADDGDIGRSGAVITLYLENNRVAFDIDLNAARQAKLVLSSKLLRLARTTQ